MEHILKKLYNGTLHPHAKYQKLLSELQEDQKSAFEAYDTFQTKLPEHLQEEFIELIDMHMDLLPLEMEQNFIDGFVTGAKLITEIYSDTCDKSTSI